MSIMIVKTFLDHILRRLGQCADYQGMIQNNCVTISVVVSTHSNISNGLQDSRKLHQENFSDLPLSQRLIYSNNIAWKSLSE